MELSIKNFRSISEEKYVFSKGNTLISGESGTGKSTILESIIWCFYGGNNVAPFKEGNKKIITKVEIKINNLLITRTKPPDKCQVIIDNDKKLEHDEAQSYINNLFGCKNLWETSCYLKQDSRSNLLFSSSQEKYSLIKEIIFGNEESKNSPESYLEKLSIFSKNLDSKLSNQDGKIEILRESIKEMKQELSSFKELEKDEKKLTKLIKKYDSIKEGIEKIKLKISNLTNIEENKKRLSVIEKELEGYPELTLKIIEKWKIWSSSVSERKNYEGHSAIETDESSETLEMEINFLERDRIKFKKNADKCKELNVMYDERRVKIEIIKTEKEIFMIEEYTNYSNIMKNINKLNEALEKTKHNIEKLNTKEAPYSDGFKIILEKLKLSRGSYCKEKVTEVREKISTIMTDYLKCPHCNKNTVLENGSLVIKKCNFMDQTELERLKRNLKNISAFYDKKQQLLSELDNYTNMIEEMEIPEKIEKREGSIPILKKYISSLNSVEFVDYDEEDFNEKKDLLEKIKIQEKIDELDKKIEENFLDIFGEYETPSDFSSYFERYQKLVSEKEILLDNLDNGSDETKEEMIEKLQKLEATIVSLDDFKVYKAIQEKTKCLVEIEESYKENVEKKGNCHRLKKIIEEESALTFENMIANFNDTLNEIVEEIFEDITIELGMFKKLKGKGELKPQFNMKVFLKGNEYDNLNFLSGGEKDRISIALTLTLSCLLNTPIIMFDESMSSLDEEMRERCLELIKKYARDKILINICHSTVEGNYDNIIWK